MEEHLLAVQRMQDWIADNPGREITLSELSRASLFSPWYSHRLFREKLGLAPAEYVRKVFGMYPDNLCTVELLCDNEVMRSVIDRFGENVQTETVDEQHFRATVEVAPSPPFFSWVFTFSGKIRIVSPAAVLEEMQDMAAWLK